MGLIPNAQVVIKLHPTISTMDISVSRLVLPSLFKMAISAMIVTIHAPNAPLIPQQIVQNAQETTYIIVSA